MKVTDSRAAAYVDQYGEESWEVDALPPNDLNLLVRQTLNAYIDKAKMQAVVAREAAIKKKIQKFASTFTE